MLRFTQALGFVSVIFQFVGLCLSVT